MTATEAVMRSENRINNLTGIAKVFVESKGRMPIDSEELAKWLVEFSSTLGDMYTQLVRLIENHLVICRSSPLQVLPTKKP